MWKDKFFIKIEPEFLFETFFNSEYVTWLYVYLKLKNHYSLQKTPQKYYNIKIEEIISFFKVDPATIYRAIRELVRIGLLEKKPKSRAIYRIKDEKDINYFTDEPDDLSVESVESVEYPNFIQIHGNAFIRLVKDLQDKSNSIPKLLRLYFFLMTTNKHTKDFVPELESPESVYSIGKALAQDARTVKPLLKTLESTGYIKLNGRKIITIRNIYTVSKTTTVAASTENECEYEFENATHCYSNSYSSGKNKSNMPTYSENEHYDY